MKKLLIVAIAVFSSCLVFCTKTNTTQVTTVTSEYTDSITLDLFSFCVLNARLNKHYVDSVKVTSKGLPFLKPIDTASYRVFSSDNEIVPAFVPKYEPTKFEAFVYDSLPMYQSDSTDTNLLATQYTGSSNYYWRLDTANAVDPTRAITRVSITYQYGYGFTINYTDFGIGKVKIYYK